MWVPSQPAPWHLLHDRSHSWSTLVGYLALESSCPVVLLPVLSLQPGLIAGHPPTSLQVGHLLLLGWDRPNTCICGSPLTLLTFVFSLHLRGCLEPRR